MELFQRAGGGLAAASIVMRPNDEKTETTDVAAAYQHDCLAHGQLMVAVHVVHHPIGSDWNHDVVM